MRPSLLLALVLVASLVLVGTAAAVAEDFQNGPGTYYGATVSPMVLYDPVSTPAYSGASDLFYATSARPIVSSTAQSSLSYSFTAVDALITDGAEHTIGHLLAVNDVNGNIIGGSYTPFVYYKTAGAGLQNAIRYYVIEQDAGIKIYANGVLVGDSGPTGMTAVPYYHFAGSAIDDVNVGGEPAGIVGVMPSAWFISKDIANSANTGLYSAPNMVAYNTIFHASYSVCGDPAGATISIDGDQQVQALDTQIVQIKDTSGVYHNTTPRGGIVTFNLTQFVNENDYGRHSVVLHAAAGDVESEFWYKGVATTETAIEWDRGVYAPQDSITITSTIGAGYYLPGTYSYKGCIYDPTTDTFKENWSITSDTDQHLTSILTANFPATGDYMVMLYAITSTGEEILLDYDTAYVYANKIIFDGHVWDAQQGTIIDAATVSVTQGAATTTDTTGSDGYFELAGLSKDVLASLSASKSGYVTAWSNTTPNEYKRYTFDIALLPSAPAHTGEAVFGVVRAYPYGSFVASPTVRILHDGTEVNSTTGADKGFFIFDGLTASETYTIEVEKDGYLDYSNAVVTGSGGSSLTEIDPWLIPLFDLTVNLVDAVSMQPITALMAVSVGGQSEQTSTGTVTFNNVQMGAASVAVVGSGYEANETALSLYDDQEITLYIMPLPVVPTTDIPLTPTPTPALVGMIGTVYDGITGTAITAATVEVAAEQGAVTRTDTTDSNGDYSIVNIQNGVLVTVNATAAGYTHTAFSFTPAGSAEYIVDLYMYRTDEGENPTIEPDAGLAGAGGTVVGGPYHELVESPTVTASNGTWSGPATLSPDHVWYFTGLEPGTAYNFTASASGFVTRSVEATMGAENSFTVVPIVLDGVYDITVTVKDADTYALILQPVKISLSDGQTGNTSTGSYTFLNLEYATYVVSATSEGYTGGGLSFLAYGDHTEYLYLAKAPSGSSSSIEYSIPPKHVELVARSIFGAPLAGVAVSIQGQSTTLPDPGLLDAIFGWTEEYSSVNLANATMTGTTGPDGAVSFLLTDTVKYLVTFTDPTRGISQTTELYPHDTQYIYVLGSAGATPAATMPNMTLWTEDAGATTTLYGYYSDPAGTTTALWFVVESQNGTALTEVVNQSYAGQQTVTASHAVNHTTGDQYVWGWRATTPERGDLEQWSGTTLHSRLIDLEIEDGWYFWISACFLFIFAGLFSGMTSRFGFILLPLFALLLWYIGWLDTSIATLGIAMIAGILMYISRVQVG